MRARAKALEAIPGSIPNISETRKVRSNFYSYESDYYLSSLFDQNYDAIANLICKTYSPSTILDVGCGPGGLAEALVRIGDCTVFGVDGFSRPEAGARLAGFVRHDLNHIEKLPRDRLPTNFDLVICVEVAEHLLPQSSESLVRMLCSYAPIVIFSAAVPNQGGLCHINLRSRDYWHELFNENGFQLSNKLGLRIRSCTSLPDWYRWNIVDYISGSSENEAPQNVIRRCIASESSLASEFHRLIGDHQRQEELLGLAPIRAYLKLRPFLKRLLFGNRP